MQATTSTGLTLQEAQQILNIKGLDDVDHIRKVLLNIRHCVAQMWQYARNRSVLAILGG